ncbi:MAG TPA: hypothetical protein VGL40_06905 [Bacillota bacterium]
MLRAVFLVLWLLTVAVNGYLFYLSIRDIRRSKAWASGVRPGDALGVFELRAVCFALLLILLAWGWRMLS